MFSILIATLHAVMDMQSMLVTVLELRCTAYQCRQHSALRAS